jgi:anti-sigma B factor antagonist
MNPHLLAPPSAVPSGHVVIALTGRIDISATPVVRVTLADAVTMTRTGLVLELSQVTFLDPSGMALLIGTRRRTRHLPDGLSLAAVPHSVQAQLDQAGLSGHLTTYPTLNAAITERR